MSVFIASKHGPVRASYAAVTSAELGQVLRLVALADEPAPALVRAALRFRSRQLRNGEPVTPLPGPRRVDDRARAEALLVRMHARIEGTAPRARDDVDRLGRFAPRADGPEHLLEVHDVDVVVYDDRVAPEVRAGVHARRGVSDLPRVSGVPLADRDRVEQTRSPDLVAPHAGD